MQRTPLAIVLALTAGIAAVPAAVTGAPVQQVSVPADIQSPTFLLIQGAAKVERGDFQGAIRDLNRVIRLNPQLPEAYALRGGAYYNLGNKRQGGQDLAQAAELYRQQGNFKNQQEMLNLKQRLDRQ